MHYSNYIFLIVLIIIIILIIELNTDFKVTNNVSESIMLKPGTLYISTHNYEHKDIFILFQYFKNFNKKFYMLFADKTWNYLLEYIKPPNIEFLYVKGKTVEKITSKLLLGENVIMFLYNHSDATGPFYICKNSKCPLLFLKIKKMLKGNNENEIIYNHANSSFYDIFIKNFMEKFQLSIKNIKYEISDNCNKITFMNQFKPLLYK